MLHCAGITDFQPDPLRALSANVDGALNVADLAARCRVPRLVHVSTCYVAGVPGGTVEEDFATTTPLGQELHAPTLLADFRAEMAAIDDRVDRIAAGAESARALGWPNLYTFSKALAEQLLRARDDVELTVVRPAIVECAQRFPFAGWNEGINTSGPIIWYTRTAFPNLPCGRDVNFDIVPVDAIAAWTTMVLGAALRGEAEPLYQFASSDVNPVTFERITDLNSLAIRKESRGKQGRGWGALLRHLDINPSSPDAPPLATPRGLLGIGTSVHGALKKVDLRGDGPALTGLSKLAQDAITSTAKRVDRTNRKLRRVDKMLDLYRPFIHDTCWVFRTGAIRRLTARLPDADQEVFGFRAADIDWRHYWIDVQYPGIVTWSLPALYGETVPVDPPSEPPLVIPETAAQRRTAAK